MNLSPDWVPVLNDHGWQAIHWSAVGDPRASDRTVMEWAVKHEHVVFTHDLDFGTMLALSHATGPSVLQIRGQDVLPDRLDTAGPARCRGGGQVRPSDRYHKWIEWSDEDDAYLGRCPDVITGIHIDELSRLGPAAV